MSVYGYLVWILRFIFILNIMFFYDNKRFFIRFDGINNCFYYITIKADIINTASQMMARVPSEPMIRSFRL